MNCVCLKLCINLASFPGSPRARTCFSVLQATESWAGPGNEASINNGRKNWYLFAHSHFAHPFILRKLTDYSRIIRYSLSYLLFFFYSGHNVVSKKGPWAVHITLCSDMGGGRIFVTLLHFTTKKPPCLHYHNYITTGYCKPTHPPSTSLIQFSVCISQACVGSHKWTSPRSNIPGKGLGSSMQ